MLQDESATCSAHSDLKNIRVTLVGLPLAFEMSCAVQFFELTGET
jgi:hypothetical protein